VRQTLSHYVLYKWSFWNILLFALRVKSTNFNQKCLTRLFRNINSHTPHQWHRIDTSPLLYLRMFRKFMIKSQNVNLYVLDFFTRLVLSRFEIVEHECDTILFVFICSIFGHPCTPFFLYHSYLPIWIFGSDFISKRAHEAMNDSKTAAIDKFYNTLSRIRASNLTLIWFACNYVTNFYWFTNTCKKLLVIRSFRDDVRNMKYRKTYNYTFRF